MKKILVLILLLTTLLTSCIRETNLSDMNFQHIQGKPINESETKQENLTIENEEYPKITNTDTYVFYKYRENRTQAILIQRRKLEDVIERGFDNVLLVKFSDDYEDLVNDIKNLDMFEVFIVYPEDIELASYIRRQTGISVQVKFKNEQEQLDYIKQMEEEDN